MEKRPILFTAGLTGVNGMVGCNVMIGRKASGRLLTKNYKTVLYVN
jgi:hypothetical protein